jgi:signal recognition particle receptor subunit beta
MGEGLNGALSGFDASPGLAPSAPAAAPLGAGIGARLEAMRRQLLGCGQTLAALVEPAGRTLIGGAIRHLEEQVCRIAVVGQIKSGKSSFINALVQQPALLPTDVTPWTTAITNLHFSQAPPDRHAAVFHFFSADEWRSLAEGGGRIRELTKVLVPGFEPQALHVQVEALKRRAGQRLGPEFERLLGQAHCFETIDPEVLRQYVCSGDFIPDARSGPIGKYSDITKTADLYCTGGPFAFPVTVTDTPGTNDPFLIRDEITRRSLDSADLYIVVLTARQPLAESDVTLLRLMRGLHKDRIVVFVNRIDDLADVGRDLPNVLAYVERRLALEFPGAHIPVVAGSAWWAGCARSLDEQTLDRLFERPSFTYLAEAGLLRGEDLVRPAMDHSASRERLCDSLYMSSGLPAMYAAIADLMNSSSPAVLIGQIARCFAEMARSSESGADGEIERLTEPGDAALPAFTARAPEQLERLQREARVLEEAQRHIEDSGKSIETQLAGIIAEEMQALSSALQGAVDSHAAVERDVLIDTLEHGRAPRVWTHEGIELRKRLSQVFMARFQQAGARVIEFQAKVAPELQRVLNLIAPGSAIPGEPDGRLLELSPPAITPLGRLIALDLDVSWWSAFWRRRPSPAACGAQFEALIKAEFQPVVEELVKSAETSLNAYSTTTTRWSFGICINIVQALERRRSLLAARCSSLHNGSDTAAEAGTHEDQSAYAGLHSGRRELCEAVTRQLEAITREIGHNLLRAPGHLS